MCFRSKDVPYSRLVEACPTILPIKLDSDSKLHFEKGKSALNVPDNEPLPKNSISDSKLAVDYFSPAVHSEGKNAIDASESHHSLNTKMSSDEQLQKAVSFVGLLHALY